MSVSENTVDYALWHAAARLRFKPYSFTDERTGRTVEGRTMYLAFPWGEIKLTAVGHKPDEVLSMLEYTSGYCGENDGTEPKGGEDVK